MATTRNLRNIRWKSPVESPNPERKAATNVATPASTVAAWFRFLTSAERGKTLELIQVLLGGLPSCGYLFAGCPRFRHLDLAGDPGRAKQFHLGGGSGELTWIRCSRCGFTNVVDGQAVKRNFQLLGCQRHVSPTPVRLG